MEGGGGGCGVSISGERHLETLETHLDAFLCDLLWVTLSQLGDGLYYFQSNTLPTLTIL